MRSDHRAFDHEGQRNAVAGFRRDEVDSATRRASPRPRRGRRPRSNGGRRHSSIAGWRPAGRSSCRANRPRPFGTVRATPAGRGDLGGSLVTVHWATTSLPIDAPQRDCFAAFAGDEPLSIVRGAETQRHRFVNQIQRRSASGALRRCDDFVGELRRGFERIDFDLQFADALQAGRRAADGPHFADRQVHSRDPPQPAVEQVHAADFLLGGGAVGRAVDHARQPDLGKAGIELVQHALHFAHGHGIERQQRRP